MNCVDQKDFRKLLHGGEQSLKYKDLLSLSALSSEESLRFESAWASAEKGRKLGIIGKLVELCEDNLELDFDSVFKISLEDATEEVRVQGIKGLWECEDRSIIRPLTDLLVDDPSSSVRAAAGMALARYAELAQDGKLLPSDGRRVLEALLAAINRKGQDTEVKRRAIEAAGHYDTPEVDEIILEAYRSEDTKLRQSSIYSMGRSSNPQWLPRVLSEMENEHAGMRYEAAVACGLLGEESAAPNLIGLLQDDDLQIQLAGIRALGTVGGPLAREALQQCTRMGDEALEEAARESLADLVFDDDPLGMRF